MAADSRNGEIELVSVTKRFGDTVAVDDMSLRIPQGAYCCLLGPSGCGKTTILRMIAGHETPSQGDIRIGGESVVGQPPLRRGTAMMFQAYALFPHLSVLDNVAFSLKMRGLDRAARQKQARELLTKVRLDHFADRLPAQLSGGQQQRVALARALITNPRVLLLDEPLSALDEYLRLRMRGELRRMQKQLGITFVHVTHTQLEAIAVADMLVVMDQGRIEQAGSPRTRSTIRRAPPTWLASSAARTCCRAKSRAWPDGMATVRDAGGARLTVPLGNARPEPGSQLYFSIRRDRIEVVRARGRSPTRAKSMRFAARSIRSSTRDLMPR